jgi:hypothetical protein
MKKGIGDKVLGWFVVQEGAEEEKEEEIDAAAPEEKRNGSGNGNPDREEAFRAVPHAVSRSTAAVVAPVVAPGHAHDAKAFAAVYRAAGVGDEERERLSKVRALLESLPDEATVDVKRAIVGASLEAFGVSIDRILVTGEGALAALDGYVVSGQTRTKDVLAEAEARIAKLTAEIDEVRRLMDVQVAAQQDLVRAAATEKARVRAVVDFFDHGASGRTPARRGDPHAVPQPRLIRLK